MDKEQFEELSEKFDSIIKLITIQTLGSKKGVEAISLLAKAGFKPKIIAHLIGTTPHTVSVALSKMRKVGNNEKKKTKR